MRKMKQLEKQISVKKEEGEIEANKEYQRAFEDLQKAHKEANQKMLTQER